MSSRTIGFSLLAAAAIVPALVFAQTPTTGLLTVYVQVINQSGFSYAPSNFSVSVSGSNPSPSTFPGSINGTLVSLNPGSFSVSIANPLNYSVSYSTGCNNTIAAGQTHTCVITLSTASAGFQNPVPYPYPSTQQLPLSCRTETPTVALGQTARFTAIGGAGGTYNWMTSDRNYPNVGPSLSVSLMTSGVQTVQVTNAAQTATCVVTVTSSYTPQTNVLYPTHTAYGSYTASAYPYPGQPTLTARVYPRFPNTGLEPLTSAQIAFALVALMGAVLMAYPYARKAFAIAVR